MTVTVTQLNRYIKAIIENDIRLSNVAVTGELSNFKLHSSGHCYMTLKDENSSIRAVMFKSSADKLRFRPENGMKVIVTAKVSVYERDGQYQLYINTMQPDGVGDLHVAYEQLKAKLGAEGLFDDSKKKKLPPYPKTVGVITSPTGAAVRDIINVATRRYPLAQIILFPVLVQGEGAAEQIAGAIKYFNTAGSISADVLIVGRGGGSIEELWAFNEEPVARAIADSQIPVISAVGHETDFTIADFVADLRAPTPSAAAELAVPSAAELKNKIRQSYGRMLFAIKKNVEGKKAILSRFSIKNPMDLINQNRIRTDNSVRRLINATTALLDAKSKRLAVAVAGINALSPLGVLSRGYSVVQKGGSLIRSITQVKSGDELSVRVSDGSIICEVAETKQ
ncbi:MAG: Exodeoxyribonuclease 7 large subunit [Firmicutes bacterium ADurb.Bin193]|nr:MAG: Exodeoxyribonuclease 7 large subunit [Firmicutes bacterium ADurb.Bin193]